MGQLCCLTSIICHTEEERCYIHSQFLHKLKQLYSREVKIQNKKVFEKFGIILFLQQALIVKMFRQKQKLLLVVKSSKV